MSDSLLIERDGGIATITFNRPDKANYIDNDWLDRMAGSFRAWRRDKTIRAVIIKSTGRYFMAGGDMNFHARSKPLMKIATPTSEAFSIEPSSVQPRLRPGQ